MSKPALDIPHSAPFTLASLEGTHLNAEITPSDMPHLAYSIAVPKTWPFSQSFGPVPTGMLEARGLGFFASANLASAPVIGVTATTIPYEIPIDAWARLTFRHEGYEVVSASWFPGPAGLFFDITGVRVTDDVAEVRRSAIRVQANEVICVNCLCSRDEWDAAKEVFWVALITFELSQVSAARMEPWLRGAAGDPGFEFAHPASWQSEPVESPPTGMSAVDVRLAGEDDKLLGYLQVSAERVIAESKPTLAQLEVRALARLATSGFAPTDAATPLGEADDPRALAVSGWLGGFRGDGTFMAGDITTRRGYLERGGVIFTLSMLSPRIANNPLVALRSQRAFEIARATLTLL